MDHGERAAEVAISQLAGECLEEEISERLLRPWKRMMINLTALMALLTICGVVPPQSLLLQEPITIGDAPPPPRNLEGLWTSSSSIIRARAGESKVIALQQRNAPPRVMRQHSVEILEVLKDDGALAGRRYVRVNQFGGTLEFQGKELTSAYSMDLIEAGDELILFLTYWKDGDSFSIAYGSAGAYWIRDGTVNVPRSARHMPAFKGRNRIAVPEFLNTLRSLPKKRDP